MCRMRVCVCADHYNRLIPDITNESLVMANAHLARHVDAAVERAARVGVELSQDAQRNELERD